ncbi:MAG: hypothetical protein BroJett025_02760 [Patescibacteria group bacterium]|nr:MAG: hypothetical protein BroJett025_02760 [Patescibacteria group bacterium]
MSLANSILVAAKGLAAKLKPYQPKEEEKTPQPQTLTNKIKLATSLAKPAGAIAVSNVLNKPVVPLLGKYSPSTRSIIDGYVNGIREMATLPTKFSNWQAENRRKISPGGEWDTAFRNNPTAQQTADITLGLGTGFQKGLAGFTGADEALGRKLYGDSYKPYTAQTTAGKIADFGGGIAGFAVGPGKILAPLEAGVVAKTSPYLGRLPGYLRGPLAGVAAESVSALGLGGIESVVKDKPFTETFGTQLAGGLAGRGLFGIAGASLKGGISKSLFGATENTAENAVKSAVKENKIDSTILDEILTGTTGEKTGRVTGINLDRLGLDDAGKQRVARTVAAVKTELEQVRGKKLTHEEVINAAKESELLSSVITKDETLKQEARLLATRNRITSINKDIDMALANNDIGKAKQLSLELINLTKLVSAEAADVGRRLESFKIRASDASTREQIIARLNKITDDSDLLAERVANTNWDDAKSINKLYREYVKPTIGQVLEEFRYNNMLSNPKSHARNILGNLEQTLFLRPAVKTLSGEPVGALKYYGGVLKSFPDATKDFFDAVRGKTNIESLDIDQIPTGKLPGVAQLPTRLLEGADRFFMRLITGGEMAAGATKEEATNTASRALFRNQFDPKNKTGQGVLLSKIDEYANKLDSLRSLPGGKWFVPFMKTPIQVFKQWIEYSPAGFSTLPGASNKKEQLAKAMLGSVFSVIGATAALNGNTTWEAPTGEKEKQLFYASGKKPYSIRIGDAWVPMNYFGSLGFALAMPAAVNYHYSQSPNALSDSQMEKLTKSFGSAFQYATQQTTLENIEAMVKVLQGDIDYSVNSTLGFTASQVIPMSGFLGYVSQWTDPFYRKASGFTQTIGSRLPGVSQKLPAYETPAGNPSMREGINKFLPYDIGIVKPAQGNELSGETYGSILDSKTLLKQKEKAAKEKTRPGILDWLFGTPEQKAQTPSNDPLIRAFNTETEKDARAARIKEVFRLGLSREETEQMLKNENLGTFEEAGYTVARSLEVDSGTRGAYIQEILRPLQGQAYKEQFTKLVTNKVLTEAVIKKYEEDSILTEEQADALRVQMKKANGTYKASKKNVYNLSVPKINLPSISPTKFSAPPISAVNIEPYTPKKLSIKMPTFQPVRVNRQPLQIRYTGARTLGELG